MQKIVQPCAAMSSPVEPPKASASLDGASDGESCGAVWSGIRVLEEIRSLAVMHQKTQVELDRLVAGQETIASAVQSARQDIRALHAGLSPLDNKERLPKRQCSPSAAPRTTTTSTVWNSGVLFGGKTKQPAAEVAMHRGDSVRITKESRMTGVRATVIDPNWHGLVKVMVDDERHPCTVKSYTMTELELLQGDDEDHDGQHKEPRFEPVKKRRSPPSPLGTGAEMSWKPSASERGNVRAGLRRNSTSDPSGGTGVGNENMALQIWHLPSPSGVTSPAHQSPRQHATAGLFAASPLGSPHGSPIPSTRASLRLSPRASQMSVPLDFLPAGSLNHESSRRSVTFAPDGAVEVIESMIPRSTLSSDTDDAAKVFTLPLHWPCSVATRANLEQDMATNADLHAVLQDSRHSHFKRYVAGNTASSSFTQLSEDVWLCSRHCILIEPTSPVRVIIDVTGLMMLLYDLVTIPYFLAWEVVITGSLQVFSFMTMFFWTFDMVANFHTGFYRNGELVMSHSKTARNYLRTWFLPDLCFVGVDWVTVGLALVAESDTASTGGDNNMRVLRISKMSRLLRIFGVLRMAKLIRLFDSLVQHCSTEIMDAMVSVLVFLFAILWSNHTIACLWWLVGTTAPSDTGDRWTQHGGTTGGEAFASASSTYQYFVAFHWATQVMTAGSMDVHPHNTYERQFNIACLVFGLLFFSCMVSLFSAKIMDLKAARQDKNTQLRMLKKFLRQKCIGKKMSLMVQKQVMDRMRTAEIVTCKDVDVLRLLSFSLRSDIQYEICSSHVLRHPFFLLWSEVDFPTLLRFCNEAVSFLVLACSDNLFLAGWYPEKAYVFAQGKLLYAQDPETAMVHKRTVCSVLDGAWICEAALWMQWLTVGTVEATVPSELLEMRGDGIGDVLPKHKVVRHIAHEYARAFRERLHSCRVPMYPWPTDLKVEGADCCDIVHLFSPDLRVFIGKKTLEAYQRLAKQSSSHAALPTTDLEQLEKELLRGQSTLVLSGSGQLQRVVSTTALRLEGDQKSLFVQLGYCEAGVVKSECKLPGLKQEEGETPEETVTRLLWTVLPPLADAVRVGGYEEENLVTSSPTYSIRTKYHRTTFAGVISPMFTVDTLLSHFRLPASSSKAAFPSYRSTPDSIYVIGKSTENCRFYAWLVQADLQHFALKDAEKELQSYLANVSRSDVRKFVSRVEYSPMLFRKGLNPNDSVVIMKGSLERPSKRPTHAKRKSNPIKNDEVSTADPLGSELY